MNKKYNNQFSKKMAKTNRKVLNPIIKDVKVEQT